MERRHPEQWVLILAGGEGTRLSSLTTLSAGHTIPKQFCSLRGGPSLLQKALHRAHSIAAPERICAAVAKYHELWWRKPLEGLPARNVFVQPSNCGTALGILWPVLHIMSLDPHARLVVLPSDHHVQDEAVLSAAMHRAVESLEQFPDSLVFLGMEPNEADPELGYIVPHPAARHGTSPVAKFVEKPTSSAASDLIRRGALWNSFILAGRPGAFLSLYAANSPELLKAMQKSLGKGARNDLDALYCTLGPVDFSRDIVPGQESRLRVLRVPPCGWSDLGTPQSVFSVLNRSGFDREQCARDVPDTAVLDLAEQWGRHHASA
jgi:mannose-1-phosphate guanylyltransferase